MEMNTYLDGGSQPFFPGNEKMLSYQKLEWEFLQKNPSENMVIDVKAWTWENSPIPTTIKNKFPVFVADACIKAGRSDLVRDLMPIYQQYAQALKKIEREEKMSVMASRFVLLIRFVKILIIFFLILFFLYAMLGG